jgi:uncharacterized protein DUF5989
MDNDALKPPEKQSFFGELWLFMKQEKKWWLTPILLILIGMSIFIILTESSAVMPFIYALF